MGIKTEIILKKTKIANSFNIPKIKNEVNSFYQNFIALQD